jgi:hypothetical protein
LAFREFKFDLDGRGHLRHLNSPGCHIASGNSQPAGALFRLPVLSSMRSYVEMTYDNNNGRNEQRPPFITQLVNRSPELHAWASW